MHGLDIHLTDVCRALITDTPALTLGQPDHLLFRQLAPGHQSALSLGKLPLAKGASQTLNAFIFSCPGTVDDVAPARLIEQTTRWIGAGKPRIFGLNWRSRWHWSPLLVEFGPQYADFTPVFPC